MPNQTFLTSFAIGATITSAFKGSMAFAKSQVGGIKEQINKLDNEKVKVDKFVKLKKKTIEAKKAFHDTQKETEKLAKKIANTDKPSKQLIKNFRIIKNRVNRLKNIYWKNENSLATLRQEMKKAGFQTTSLITRQTELSKALDKARLSQDKLQKIGLKQKKIATQRDKFRKNLVDTFAIGVTIAMFQFHIGLIKRSL